VEAVSGEGTISAIPLDTTTGGVSTTLTVQTANLSATTVQQLAISPDGNFVFVALGTGGTEEIPFNAANTNPFGSSGQVVKPANPTSSSAASALSVAVDPTSRLVYIGETLATTGSQTGGLRVFPLTTSGLGTEVTGSPYATGGTGPSAILPDPTGTYVYAANKAVSGQTTSLVDAYSIQATTSVYSLTSLGTIATGTTPSGIAEDSTKTYLLVVNSGGSPDLNAYTFDTTTPGMLVSFVTATTGTDPVGAISIVAIP
jgi:6-phosphogluconolactonase (cycloisomerase 2 family)